jgi:hypothetical protein
MVTGILFEAEGLLALALGRELVLVVLVGLERELDMVSGTQRIDSENRNNLGRGLRAKEGMTDGDVETGRLRDASQVADGERCGED